MIAIPAALTSDHVISGYALTTCPDPNVQALEALTSFAQQSGRSTMERCCVSGLWLLHNFLDHSHKISQSIDQSEGSYWHAIMHRTEGDFGNSKYWYRRAGDHPIFETLGDEFDPYDFVDQCESEYRGRGNMLSEATQQMAYAEWKALFEYCQANA